MSDHRDKIRALMADYLCGRLDPARHDEVGAALTADPDLAAEFRFASDLREAWAESSAMSPQRLVEIADGSPMSPAEEEHLATHAGDRRQLELLQRIGPPPLEVARGRRARGPWPRSRESRGWAFGAVAIAAALLLYLGPWSGTESLRPLAQFEVLPVRTTRTAPARGSFEDYRQRGLQSYKAREWERATALLDSAQQRQADSAEVLLYRASAFAQLDRFEAAAGLLRRADSLFGDPGVASPVHEEVLWQWAQCALATERRDSARELLERLRDHHGARAARAARQLEAIESGEPADAPASPD